jgi:hypothetical protein
MAIASARLLDCSFLKVVDIPQIARPKVPRSSLQESARRVRGLLHWRVLHRGRNFRDISIYACLCFRIATKHQKQPVNGTLFSTDVTQSETKIKPDHRVSQQA